MTDARPPRDDLVRASLPGVEVRAAGDGAPRTMTGHFSVFDQWTRISSSWEGTFMERFAPGAFTKTFKESTPKVLFQHGKDPQVGDKPLGTIRSISEDAQGAAYEVELLDTAYVRDLIPGLEAGLYGASFRFSVVKEDFDPNPKRSAHNPDGIPERTVREARVMEFGPVTFPAYAGATAGMRSMTDEFLISRLAADPERLASLITSALPARAEAEPHSDIGEPPPISDPPPVEEARTTQDPPNGGSSDSKETPVSEYQTRDEKVARVAELRSSISRRAVEFDGVLPPDVQALDDKENREHDELERAIAAWDARQARIASFSGDPARTEPAGIPYTPPNIVRKQTMEDIHDLGRIRNETRSREEYDTKVRENALRSIESARISRNASVDDLVDVVTYRDEGEEGSGEIARRVLLTGAPAYRRAFNKYLRGEKDLWTPEEARAAALAVTGTTTTGGYAVPYVFDPTIIKIGSYTATNPFRQACRVETITNGNNWRTVTVGAVTTTYITEAGAATEQGPTFGQPTYTVQSAHAFATVSHETMQDRPDIGDELGAVFAESKATYEENQFAVGAGTTVYPMGMFTDTAYTNQDTATNDVTALLDFTVCETALPLRFRANAAWFMNRSTIRQLEILDTTYRYFSGAGIQFQGGPGNAPMGLGPGPQGFTGKYLLGYPIWEVPSAVSTLTTDGAIIAVLCDPKSYIIVDRMGMSIEVIPNMLNGATPSFPTGQRGVYARFRNTAKPLTATAGISLSVQ